MWETARSVTTFIKTIRIKNVLDLFQNFIVLSPGGTSLEHLKIRVITQKNEFYKVRGNMMMLSVDSRLSSKLWPTDYRGGEVVQQCEECCAVDLI